MIDRLLAQMTVEEKASMTAGRDMWFTVGIERLGIPRLKMTDGHNGARGGGVLGAGGATAVCVPCGSALGATWDAGLVEAVGAMLGEETRTKACRVLLAPTVNIHRSPLAGRNFECYSEDPLLTGKLAAAFVRGVQSQGVATTVKHFAGNECETARFTVDSVIDERALREIYLLPFELAVREGGTLGVMTAYNRLNGHFCGEHEELISTILRGEWGFDGFVVSDWYAAGSTSGSASAGLDLEMPGPARFFGPALADAVVNGEVDESLLDGQVRRLLSVIDRVGAWDDPPKAEERSVDRADHRELARRAATDAMVLLKNDGVLPLDPTAIKTLAVIGPNAARAQIMGGGSASINAHYRVTPLEALRGTYGVRYERGSDIGDTTAWLPVPMSVEFTVEGAVVDHIEVQDTRIIFLGPPAPGVESENYAMRATGTFTPEETGEHTFTLVQSGRARLLIDGRVVLDGVADPPPPGTGMFGFGSEEIVAAVALTQQHPVELVIEYSSEGATILTGVEIACRPPERTDLIERAVAAARDADAVVVVVGTTDVQESEDRDRTSLSLPGAQDALVDAVLAANPRTAIVVNSGAAVAMEWAPRARCVLQAWFGGQEMANALVDVVSGTAEPGGRLPVSIAERIEHTPSYGNFPGAGGQTVYGEGVFVGYRWYASRGIPTRFPFGHGLSYTTFAIGAPVVSGRRIEVPVTNTGARRGAEVVQCYVVPPPVALRPPTLGNAQRLARPAKELKGWAKVWLDPGETTTAIIELDERAFAYWQPSEPGWEAVHAQVLACNPEVRATLAAPPEPGWTTEPGEYWLEIGRSSEDIAHRVAFIVG
ncbi:MAG: beta-glucosidase H [Acidimicrobiales bacterium]